MTLADLILLLFAGTFVTASPMTGGAADPPFQVSAGQRQLFLDDVGIERMDNITRVVHSPERHADNPLLSPDTPWERGCQVYGTAYYDETARRFKLWYLTGPKDRGLKLLKLDDY